MKKKIKIKLTLPHHKTHSRMTEMAWNEEEKKVKKWTKGMRLKVKLAFHKTTMRKKEM